MNKKQLLAFSIINNSEEILAVPPFIVISKIASLSLSKYKKGIVFLLWGGYAQKKKKLIDAQRHLVLESGHPSPLSANRGYWFGNRHFSKCNAYLKSKGNTPIDWHLD